MRTVTYEQAVIEAAQNLVKVKGRHHSEQAYQRLVDAVAALNTAPDHPATAGDAVYDAIGILTEFADDLCSCHTITPDDWDDEPDAKAEYDRIIRCVAQLQAMRASEVKA